MCGCLPEVKPKPILSQLELLGLPYHPRLLFSNIPHIVSLFFSFQVSGRLNYQNNDTNH